MFTRAWDIRPGNLDAPPLVHESRVRFARISRDSRFVVTAADDGTTRVWLAESGQTVGDVIQHEGQVIGLELSPSVPEFVTTTAAGVTKVWSLPDAKMIRMLEGEEEMTASMRLSADGEKLLIARVDGKVTLEPIRPGPTKKLEIQVPSRVARAEFDAETKRILTIGADRTARLWDSATGELLLDGLPFVGRHPVMGATFSPDGERIMTHSMNMARVWSTFGEEVTESPLEHGSFIRYAGFDRDGSRAFTASFDRTVRIWDTESGDPVGMPLLHSASVVHATILPDNARLLSTTVNHRCQLWDLVTGQPISEPYRSPHQHIYGTPRMRPHETTSLSRDGRWLAMAVEENVLKVWPILDPPVPVPDWLPIAAEQLAGERINERGSLVNTDGQELPKLFHRLMRSRSDDFYTRWGRWLLTERGQQTISPWSNIRRRELKSNIAH